MKDSGRRSAIFQTARIEPASMMSSLFIQNVRQFAIVTNDLTYLKIIAV